MDLEDIILEILQYCETIEDTGKHVTVYTCSSKSIDKYEISSLNNNIFSDSVITGDLCICSCCDNVAIFLFFLLKGIIDYGKKRHLWYEYIIREANVNFEDMTPLSIFNIWTEWYKENLISLNNHDITLPITVKPIDDLCIVSTPLSLCDIWTLPRIKRLFSN